MKKISSKGQIEIQNIIFLGGELLIGALIVLGAAWFVTNGFANSEEEIISRDFSLAVNTMLGSPGEFDYRYYPNTEKHTITIDDKGGVTVRSSEGGIGKYRILPMKNVPIEASVIRKKVSIPISFDPNKGVSFGSDFGVGGISICKIIQNSFSSKPKIFVDKFTEPNIFWRDILSSLVERIKALNRIDGDKAKFEIVDNEAEADIGVFLAFEDNSNFRFEIEYFVSQDNSGYQRMACFITDEIANNNVFDYADINYASQITTEQLFITIGDFNQFKEKSQNDNSLLDELAKAINNGLGGALE